MEELYAFIKPCNKLQGSQLVFFFFFKVKLTTQKLLKPWENFLCIYARPCALGSPRGGLRLRGNQH